MAEKALMGYSSSEKQSLKKSEESKDTKSQVKAESTGAVR